MLAIIIQSVVPAATTLIPVLLATYGSRKVLSEKLDRNIRQTSMLLMHDEHLSLESRIIAGDEFIAAGGNGTGKVFHKELVRQYNEQLKERGIE